MGKSALVATSGLRWSAQGTSVCSGPLFPSDCCTLQCMVFFSSLSCCNLQCSIAAMAHGVCTARVQTYVQNKQNSFLTPTLTVFVCSPGQCGAWGNPESRLPHRVLERLGSETPRSDTSDRTHKRRLQIEICIDVFTSTVKVRRSRSVRWHFFAIP